MTKSFVFRNQNKRLCGYLLQRESEIRVCIHNKEFRTEVSVVYEDGEIKLKEIAGDGKETTWKDEDKGIIGAYVEEDGRLLMDTGEAAEGAFLQRKQRIQRKRADAEKDKKQKKQMNMHADGEHASSAKMDGGEERQTAAERKKEDDLQKDCSELYTVPQRRWPPPVLLLHPVYQNGKWIERNTVENADESI